MLNLFVVFWSERINTIWRTDPVGIAIVDLEGLNWRNQQYVDRSLGNSKRDESFVFDAKNQVYKLMKILLGSVINQRAF